MLWSLPADGSCKSLMEDDAEIWPSFMNLDFIPSGDKQPMKIKIKKHRYSHNDTGRFLSTPQRLPLSIPIKIAIHRKIKSPRATMGRGKGSPPLFSVPFPMKGKGEGREGNPTFVQSITRLEFETLATQAKVFREVY